jgi:two-component system, NarL family, response regulator LiaR
MVEREGEREGERERTRVVVVDDHHAMRMGITAALLATDDIELVGEAADGQEALRVCEEVRPDVVIMDLKLPVLDGISAIRELHQRDPAIRVLALTSFPDDSWVEKALHAGATGYLLKNVELDELIASIRATHQGRMTLSPETTQALIRSVASGASNRNGHSALPNNLTVREREVLSLLADGLRNQQIAERLTISTATVKYHLQHLYSKLWAKTRTELVIKAMQQRMVDTAGPRVAGPPNVR